MSATALLVTIITMFVVTDTSSEFIKMDGLSVTDSLNSASTSNHSGRDKTMLANLFQDKLDDMVWNNLMDTLENSSMIKERVKRDLLGGKYDTSSSRKRVNKELKDIRKEIKSLEKSRVNLLKEKFLGKAFI